MRRILQLTKNKCKNRKRAYYSFIFISTLSWTVPPFLVVLAGCVLLRMSMIHAFSTAMTVSGITGTAIGFFGSLLYLIRTEQQLSVSDILYILILKQTAVCRRIQKYFPADLLYSAEFSHTLHGNAGPAFGSCLRNYSFSIFFLTRRNRLSISAI